MYIYSLSLSLSLSLSHWRHCRVTTSCRWPEATSRKMYSLYLVQSEKTSFFPLSISGLTQWQTHANHNSFSFSFRVYLLLLLLLLLFSLKTNRMGFGPLVWMFKGWVIGRGCLFDGMRGRGAKGTSPNPFFSRRCRRRHPGACLF